MKYIISLILSLFFISGYSQTIEQKIDILDNIIGPEYKGTADNGYWEIYCSEPIIVTSNADCIIQNIDIYGNEGSYPLIEFELWSGDNSKLHDLTISVWDKDKNYPVSLYFDNGQSINLNFSIKNFLNPDYKNSNAGYIQFTQIGSNTLSIIDKFWGLLLNSNITKLIVDGKVINFNDFTYSEFVFRTLLKQYATKVKSGGVVIKQLLK